MFRFRSLPALAVIASLGFGSIAPAPAQAGGDDAARFFAGLLGVAILVAVINDINKNQPAPQVTRRKKVVIHNHTTPPVSRPLPRHMQRYQIPGKCVSRDSSRTGIKARVRAQCLQNNFAYSAQLPRQCAYRHWHRKSGEMRTSYGLRCLQQRGYRIAGH